MADLHILTCQNSKLAVLYFLKTTFFSRDFSKIESTYYDDNIQLFLQMKPQLLYRHMNEMIYSNTHINGRIKNRSCFIFSGGRYPTIRAA